MLRSGRAGVAAGGCAIDMPGLRNPTVPSYGGPKTAQARAVVHSTSVPPLCLAPGFEFRRTAKSFYVVSAAEGGGTVGWAAPHSTRVSRLAKPAACRDNGEGPKTRCATQGNNMRFLVLLPPVDRRAGSPVQHGLVRRGRGRRLARLSARHRPQRQHAGADRPPALPAMDVRLRGMRLARHGPSRCGRRT